MVVSIENLFRSIMKEREFPRLGLKATPTSGPPRRNLYSGRIFPTAKHLNFVAAWDVTLWSGSMVSPGKSTVWSTHDRMLCLSVVFRTASI